MTMTTITAQAIEALAEMLNIPQSEVVIEHQQEVFAMVCAAMATA